MSESVSLGSFDPSLVALSFLISVFGSWCGLTCAGRARRRTGGASVVWLLAAAVSIGGGAIWSMHFIGMLAYQSGTVYTLDIKVTVLSLLLAIVASAIGMTLAIRITGVAGYVVGGLVTGGGVCVMHYTGMSAMKMTGAMQWRPTVVGISIVIAVVAATLALYFALNLRRTSVMIVAAVVMGLGVCAMHYTGMFAMVVHPSTEHLDLATASAGTDPFSLAMPIFGISSILMLLLLFAGLFDESGLDERDGDLEPAG
ncbi:MHYT domain-containing protein [Nocardioides cheoyonin]|uniref:MHYT domain-containing protein n=1 Tax=Nocardioides cheoyonin TaxID=3156615 RepID=UPI0032B46334